MALMECVHYKPSIAYADVNKQYIVCLTESLVNAAFPQ